MAKIRARALPASVLAILRPAALLLSCLVTSWSAAAAPTDAGGFPFPLKVTKLENGLTVVRIPFPSTGLVAFDTVVRVGSRNETEAHHTGFAHFFEHMMFRGTPKYPGSAAGDRLAGLGFVDNAFTQEDLTLFFRYGPSAGLEELVYLEADRFQNLAYDEPAFRTEARAVLGEYHKNAAGPELKLLETLSATAFKRHPYGHTVLGYYEDVKQMPEEYAYSRDFFKRWYTPDNAIIVIAGDFDDAKLMSWVTSAYGGWKGKAPTAPVPAEPPQGGHRHGDVKWAQPTLARRVDAWRVPAARLDTMDGAVAEVLGNYLAGPTSPLFRQAVLEKQWAEGLGGDGGAHRDPSLLTVDVTLKQPAFEAPYLKALNVEIKALVSNKVDAARVKEIQSALRYGVLMHLETPQSVAQQVAVAAGLYGAPDALEKQLQALARVTPAQLVAFMRKNGTDANRTVVVVHPPKAEAESPAADADAVKGTPPDARPKPPRGGR